LTVRVGYEARRPSPQVIIEAFFYSVDGRVLFCQETTALDGEQLDLPEGVGGVEFDCLEMPLQPGEYIICGSIRDGASHQILSWLSGPTLTVHPGRMVRGHFYVPHTWRHVAQRAPLVSAP
jgi:hypothetical protein